MCLSFSFFLKKKAEMNELLTRLDSEVDSDNVDMFLQEEFQLFNSCKFLFFFSIIILFETNVTNKIN